MTDDKITIEDFIKIDLRIGKILHAEEVEDSRKMLKLDVPNFISLGSRFTITTTSLLIKSSVAYDFLTPA